MKLEEQLKILANNHLNEVKHVEATNPLSSQNIFDLAEVLYHRAIQCYAIFAIEVLQTGKYHLRATSIPNTFVINTVFSKISSLSLKPTADEMCTLYQIYGDWIKDFDCGNSWSSSDIVGCMNKLIEAYSQNKTDIHITINGFPFI